MYQLNSGELFLLLAVCSAGSCWIYRLLSVAKRDERKAQGAAPIAMLRVSQGGRIEATPEARALLGLSGAEPLSEGQLFSRLKCGRARVEEAFRRLVRDGVSFRLTSKTEDGRLIFATGRPSGASAVMLLDDRTGVSAAGAEAGAGHAQAERCRDALKTAGVLILAPPGDMADDSDIANRLRPALAAEAAPGDQAQRRISLPQEDGAVTVWDITAHNGVTIAQDAGRTLAAERAMTSFVETISRTFAHLKVGLLIFDAERRLTLFNPVVAGLCNEQAEWLALRPTLRELLDRMRRARTLPEQAEYAIWRRRLLTRVSGEFSQPFEESWHLQDGRTLEVVFRPHVAGGLAVVIEDVTESLALRRVNAVERAARDATTDILEEGVVIFGPDGRYRKSNDAFRRIWEIKCGAPAWKAHVDEVISACKVLSGEHRFWTRLRAAALGGAEKNTGADSIVLSDGRRFSARISPMPDGATLAVFVDVTASEQVAVALKERNDALEQAEEMRSALIDQISHQMRTPLNSIFGFGQLLDSGKTGPLTDIQADYIRGIVSSSMELLVAIDGMSDLISVGADAPREARVAFDPLAALREVCVLAERRLERRECMRITAQNVPALVIGPRVRFRQIIFNLAADALAKSPEGSEVLLTITAKDDDLLLECRHEQLSDMEEQGLALNLVHRFVRLNGGEVKTGRDSEGRRILRCRLDGAAAQKADPPAPEALAQGAEPG